MKRHIRVLRAGAAGGTTRDTGWLSFSADHGAHWPAPRQAPADRLSVPRIMEVAAGAPGAAYAGWLPDASPEGCAQYLRPFSISRGWLSAPVRISSEFGGPAVWPGDTFGISALTPRQIVLSWGSAPAATGKKSQLFAAAVGVHLSP